MAASSSGGSPDASSGASSPAARVPAGAPRRVRRVDALPPEALVLLGALSVQGGAGLATALIRTYGPLPVAAMRIAFGAIMLVVLRPPRIRRASRGALRAAILLGIALALMNSLFYVAISRIPLGVAVTIEFSGPLAVAVLGSRRLRDLLWVALAAVGIYILAGGRLTADDAVGVLAAFLAGVCWACYILAGSLVGREWPDGGGLSMAMVVATAIAVPAALLFGNVPPLVVAPGALVGGVAVALFSSAIPYSAEIAALRRLRPSTFGVLMSLDPAIAAAVGFVALGQALHPLDLVAICCVVIASAASSLSARQITVAPGELEAA